MKELRVKFLSHTAKMPVRAHEWDAGLDIHADEDALVQTVGCTIVHTGVAVEIEPGYVGLVMGRSSMAKAGVHTYPGVIDSGFVGNIRVGLQSLSGEPYQVKRGDRIAQLLIVPICLPIAVETDDLVQWGTRGEGALGSTGK
jgi:dUTP pyrophosphatase